jgi:hypothetical protein
MQTSARASMHVLWRARAKKVGPVVHPCMRGRGRWRNRETLHDTLNYRGLKEPTVAWTGLLGELGSLPV